jgi:pimeloyl-ACP methyl ester carboxylesterase
MSMQTTQLTAVNGAELEIRERGTGEPVVFVHGAMGDECVAALSEPALINHYRLIDYHRRGYGRSQRPGDSPVTIAQQVTDLRAIMRHLGVVRAHLVGQSYGGVIILQMALDHPEAVQTLALLEPALPSILFNSPEFNAVGATAGGLYGSGDKAGAMECFGQEVAGADFHTTFDQTLPPGYFERWVADSDTVFQSDMAALPAWQFTREDAARITQPVLNARGANTPAYFRDIYTLIGEWLPQAENFIVPDAPHAMLQANPKAITQRLADFFQRHSLSG